MDTQKSESEFSFKSLFVPFTTLKAIHWIIIIGIVLFFNGLFNQFVGDDLGQIVDNPLVHSISNFFTFFSGSTFYNGNGQLIGNYFRPLYIIFFASIYSIFGPSYFAFHFFQIVLSITGAVLVFIFLRRFVRKSIAFVLSIIFLIHPINSEISLYISETQEVLFFFFGLLYLLLLKVEKSKLYILANIFLLLSLFSKETGIIFFGIAFVSTLFFDKKRIIKIFLSGSLVVIFYILLRFHAIGFISNPSNSPIAHHSLSIRLMNIPEMFFYYLKTFFYPVQLSSSYQWVISKINFTNFFLPLIFDICFLIALFIGGWILCKKKLRKNFNAYVFFCIWFGIGMVVHVQIIPLDATVAEGWFYFPMVGLLGMIGIFGSLYYQKLKNIYVFIFLTIILSLLFTRTFTRTYDWRNEFTIATHDLSVSKSAWGLENELSYAYFTNGNYQKAAKHAQNSVNIYPFMTNYLNLGAAYFAMGNYPSAESAFLNSLKFGDSYQTYENLGFLSLSFGDPRESISFIKNNALRKYPRDAKLWLCLSALEYNFGDKNEAKYDISQAILYDNNTKIVGTYNAIMNNQPVNIPINLK